MVAVAHIAWDTYTTHPALERLGLWAIITIYLAWLEANPIKTDAI